MGRQTLAKVAMRGFGVFFCGGTQNPTGHRPGQPALGDPT